MEFYSNVSYRNKDNKLCVVGYRDGKRFSEEVECEPYCFVPAQGLPTTFHSLKGIPLVKKTFTSRKHFRNAAALYGNLDDQQIMYGFGHREFEIVHNYINDRYSTDIEFEHSKLSLVVIDIETDSKGGFQNMETGDKAVITISLAKNGKYIVLGTRPYKTDNPNVTYLKCQSEKDLLNKFLIIWNSKQFAPDIVTGWNVEEFDMPYLMKRIEVVLGNKHVSRLSPFGFFVKRFVPNRFNPDGPPKEMNHPAGITILDYLVLYKKFSYTPQENYTLDHVSFMELGRKKLDYNSLGFDTLAEFYEKDFFNFVNYNIIDVELVYEMENKLKLIEQAVSISYAAKVNLVECLTTVRIWDVMIHNHLRTKNIIVPYHTGFDVATDEKIQGAFVKTPKVGMYEWVVSFDLNSLYPHIIMQYNISPETFVDQIHGLEIENLINGGLLDEKIKKETVDNNKTICGSGCMFDRDRQGFLPFLMEKMYNDRVVWKNRMLVAKQELEKATSKTRRAELVNEIARCNNMQQAKKIQLNSAYGALANKHFRWFKRKYAESITLSGQLAIRWIEKHINILLNDKMNTVDVDYVIACDTDSMYLNLDTFVTKNYPKQTDEQIVDSLDVLCQQVLEPYIDQCFDQLAVNVNAFQQKMKMKREAIANKGIWTGKKHYILNVYDNEGVRYAKPRLKMQGIEAVKSSTPIACKESIKATLELIMASNEETVIDYIAAFKEKFYNLPFEQVAFPRGIMNIEKWRGTPVDKITLFDDNDEYSDVEKGCPIHVRGAIVYNTLIESKNLESKYLKIRNGDKTKFSYLTLPNPTHQHVIATLGRLPKELGLDQYVDIDMQFEKTFLGPIKTILNAVGWKAERTISLFD